MDTKTEKSKTICPQCKGYGKVVDKIPAGANKDGMKSVEETIKIKIPTGVEDGNYMTLDNQGNEDIYGQAGDLYVFFEEEKLINKLNTKLKTDA